jgi:hypothetical protein
MQADVTFRNMPAHLGAEATIDRWLWRIEELAHLEGCTVTVERIPRTGIAVEVALDAASGGRIRAHSRTCGSSDDDGDVYVAIACAFRDARREVLARTARMQPTRLTA